MVQAAAKGDDRLIHQHLSRLVRRQRGREKRSCIGQSTPGKIIIVDVCKDINEDQTPRGAVNPKKPQQKRIYKRMALERKLR